MQYDEQGYSTYYDAGEEMIGEVFDPMMGIAGLAYVPDLGPVGSGASGTYYPRDTSKDAEALQYLGFMSALAVQDHVGTTGSQTGDMAERAGAWDPAFQSAVKLFQASAGLSADGWIGPNTRKALGDAVAKKNATEPPFSPPAPIFPPPAPARPSLDPTPPAPGPGPAPAPKAASSDNTILYLGLAAGAAVLGYLGYKAIR